MKSEKTSEAPGALVESVATGKKGGPPPKSIGLYDGLSDPPRQGGRRDRQALCGPDTDTKEGQISKTEP